MDEPTSDRVHQQTRDRIDALTRGMRAVRHSLLSVRRTIPTLATTPANLMALDDLRDEAVRVRTHSQSIIDAVDDFRKQAGDQA